jgi:thiol:disulfide interchange protein
VAAVVLHKLNALLLLLPKLQVPISTACDEEVSGGGLEQQQQQQQQQQQEAEKQTTKQPKQSQSSRQQWQLQQGTGSIAIQVALLLLIFLLLLLLLLLVHCIYPVLDLNSRANWTRAAYRAHGIAAGCSSATCCC